MGRCDREGVKGLVWCEEGWVSGNDSKKDGKHYEKQTGSTEDGKEVQYRVVVAGLLSKEQVLSNLREVS